MEVISTPKPPTITFAVRMSPHLSADLHEAAKRHGFPNRNQMLQHFCEWIATAEPEEIKALNLR